MTSENFLDFVDLNSALDQYSQILQIPLAIVRPDQKVLAQSDSIAFDRDFAPCLKHLPSRDSIAFNDEHDTCWVIVPLMVDETTLEGNLVGYCSPSPEATLLLERVSALVAHHLVQLLVKEIKIYQKEQELSHRYEELEFLYEVGEVLSNVSDVQEATQRILSKAMQVLKVEKGSVMLVDQAGDLTIFASTGIPKDIVDKTHLKSGEGIAGKVLQTGEPMLSENIEQEVYYESKVYKQYRSGTFMSLPISLPTADAERKILGVLNLNDKMNGMPFHANDLKLASVIATQAAIFIENARNYENILNEKKKLETILSDMGDGVVVTDHEFNVTLLNDMAQNMLDTSLTDVIGQNYYNLIRDYELSTPLELLQQSTAENLQYDITVQKHPLRTFSVNMTRIYNKDDQLLNIVVLLRDITEKKTQEIMKTEFLSLISHKLRTPLVGLVGYPQFLLDETLGSLNSQQRQAIETIGKQSQYLTRLVDQLLRFTELESQKLELHIEAQHPYLLLKASIDDNQKLATQKQIEIRLETKDLPPFIYVDGERVIEILVNLINNAIKFSPENSVVDVFAEKIEGDYIQISVRDRGIGIEPKYLHLIFERFYQIEEYFTGQVEGAGLGLSVVRHLVEAHHGKVWAESEYGNGCQFFVQLPILELKPLAKYDFEID